MKLIVIAPSLAGKTTLARYLKPLLLTRVCEIDELITKINGGVFPTDDNYKHRVIAPKVIKYILDQESILFLTNTDYWGSNDLVKAKENGFKIVLINTPKDELLRRNVERMKHEGYADMSVFIDGMLLYMNSVKNLADREIDGTLRYQEIGDIIVALQ